MTQPLRRSVLYTPASNERALQKLNQLGCDCVIIDLEDAVSPSRKAGARERAVQVVADLQRKGLEVIVRCNGLDTPWGAEDLDAVAQAHVKPDAVLVPKVPDATGLAPYAALLPPPIGLWAMIETCGAVLDVAGIARADRVNALVFGANDLMAEMGARHPQALTTARVLTVTAARAARIAVLDGVYNDHNDDAGFERACQEAADYGFDGKTLIHPRQIAICHRLFAPTPAQTLWARTVIDAFDRAEALEAGVISIEGVMVERLHLEQARRLLAAHEVASGAQSA